MKSIINYINQPFPYFKKKWLVVVVSTVWVFLIFSLLQPFGNGLKIIDYNFVIIYFTLSMAISSYIVAYISPLIFRKFHQPENWTKGKFFLFSLGITTFMWVFTIFANHYGSYVENIAPRFSPFGRVAALYGVCFFVSLFPTIIIYLVEDKLEANRKLNQIDESYYDKTDDINLLKISGKTKDELTLLPEEFLYAEVMKNYVTIYYLRNNNIESKSIRTTLAQLIELFQAYPYIIQCHRAYIVNTSFITNITGNSHGYQLNLQHAPDIVPVSKSYTKMFKELMKL